MAVALALKAKLREILLPGGKRAGLPALALLVLLVLLGIAPVACGDDDPPADPIDAGADVIEEPPEPPKSDGSSGGIVIEVDCPVGTVVELEDNNTPQLANDLDTGLTFCGTLSTGADVDYSKFTTPPGKKLALFQGVIDGKVDFDLVVNGKTFQPGEVKKFEAGAYVIKAYTKDNKPAKYRYRIQYEP